MMRILGRKGGSILIPKGSTSFKHSSFAINDVLHFLMYLGDMIVMNTYSFFVVGQRRKIFHSFCLTTLLSRAYSQARSLACSSIVKMDTHHVTTTKSKKFRSLMFLLYFCYSVCQRLL